MILNKCPICGSELEYNLLYQFTKPFKILKSGKLSIRPKREKADICPMECGFISCTNTNCGFHTNCDLEVEENFQYKIFLDDDNNYNIEFDDNVPGQMSIETLENGKYMPEHS
jgi:hypothetical protein